MSLASRLLSAFSLVSAYRASNGTRSHEENNNFNWRDAIADALIYAGFSFFFTLSGISIAQIVTEPVKALLAAGISAGLAFFTLLSLKRGLISNPPEESRE